MVCCSRTHRGWRTLLHHCLRGRILYSPRRRPLWGCLVLLRTGSTFWDCYEICLNSIWKFPIQESNSIQAGQYLVLHKKQFSVEHGLVAGFHREWDGGGRRGSKVHKINHILAPHVNVYIFIHERHEIGSTITNCMVSEVLAWEDWNQAFL